jgi:hypothetical protein
MMHDALYSLIEDARRYQTLANRAHEVLSQPAAVSQDAENWQHSCVRSHGRATTEPRKPRGCSPSEWPSSSSQKWLPYTLRRRFGRCI